MTKWMFFIWIFTHGEYNFVFFLDSSNVIGVRVVDFYKTTAGGHRSLNVLGLILFCFVFGTVLSKMDKAGEILVQFFEALNEASIRMIKLVMMWVPNFGLIYL